MKPRLEHLPVKSNESFFMGQFDHPYFATPWHYHPEYELVLVEESDGKRFVGNSIGDFGPGDFSLFGPNLPHLYKNPPAYYQKKSKARARSVVIHFLEESLGRGFLELPQTRKLRGLFERSQQGMDFYGKTRETVAKRLPAMCEAQGLPKLIQLLEILDILADSSEYRLVSEAAITGHNLRDTDRLNQVFQYILQNFDREVKLEEVAALVFMTRTSFCRFFLERTKRTFSDYLQEVRLNHAAKMLREDAEAVADVAYRSGYNNLSNFNRQFKEKFHTTPGKFRRTALAMMREDTAMLTN